MCFLSHKVMRLLKKEPVELLLGKAYSDFGHVGDAIAVYDQLISTHTDDFRGYLAKACKWILCFQCDLMFTLLVLCTNPMVMVLLH
ncbi:Tetratricopeptide repeat (TPR) superfamily protein [Trifolium repens]|nr:Tetratricopeptide repeat (TPR) superfamily protein [Trifolium repens]